MANNYITAGEIGDYVYCQRAWWLRIQGLLTANKAMHEGEIKHTQLSQWLSMYKKILAFAIALIIIGCIIAGIAYIFFLK